MAINLVFLQGNVGRAPELQHTTTGTPVVKFGLATTDRFKGKDGEFKENTIWHTVRCWRNTAEFAAKYITKGAFVFVEGHIAQEQWTDKEGQQHTNTIIEAENVQLLGGRKDTDQQQRNDRDYQRGSGNGGTRPRIKSRAENDYETNHGDLPF